MATMTSLAEEEDFADLQEVAKSVALIHLLPHLALAGCRGGRSRGHGVQASSPSGLMERLTRACTGLAPALRLVARC